MSYDWELGSSEVGIAQAGQPANHLNRHSGLARLWDDSDLACLCSDFVAPVREARGRGSQEDWAQQPVRDRANRGANWLS